MSQSLLQGFRLRIATYSIVKLEPLCELPDLLAIALSLRNQTIGMVFFGLSRSLILEENLLITGRRVGKQAETTATLASIRLHSKNIVKSSESARLATYVWPFSLGRGIRMKSGFASFSVRMSEIEHIVDLPKLP